MASLGKGTAFRTGRLRKTLILLVAAVLTAALACPAPARAQSIALVRDAEIENDLKGFATPVFEAAGLEAQDISIHIVQSDDVNAFVAFGQNMFISTGLLLFAQNANQVTGVMAHEAGHIAGGHLARREEEMREAMMQQIVSLVLGAGAAVGGSPGAAQGIVLGGQQIAQRGFLAYSRGHEASADAAAIKFMEETKQSPRGLMDFLTLLSEKEARAVQKDEYVRTHPLTPDRIEFVRDQLKISKYADAPSPPGDDEKFARIQAKLTGFLEPLTKTLQKYPETDQSLAGRYARAIAYYRKPDMSKALPLIDGLIAEHPKDPYFWELKGQMLFENGRLAESIPAYEQAVKLLPESTLLRIGLAQSYLETNNPAYVDAALANLHEAVAQDGTIPSVWRQLAVAYGRKGEFGLSALALAERAFLLHQFKEASAQIARAEKMLPVNSAGWQRAEDLKLAIKNAKDAG